MGILSFITGKHFDEQDDSDEQVNDFEEGAEFAREQIDWSRENYQEHGHSSFQESVEIGGKAWHQIVEREQYLVSHGHPERQGRLNHARGARSMYD